jgi:hypothetical protein
MMRVLAHAHTTWSYDGTLTLADWAELAQTRQVDAVLLTEHEETGWSEGRYRDYVAACQSATRSDVRLLPGIEFNQDGFHVLCYGLKQWPHRPSSVTELAAAVHVQGCWLCLAHPGKYQWQYPDGLLACIDAVEVWNSKWIYDGALGPHPSSLKLAQEKSLLVGQDVHKAKHLSSLYLHTATQDILADLTAGRYWIGFGRARWTQAMLRQRRGLGLVQRMRTRMLRGTLAVRRRVRNCVRKSSGTGEISRPGRV